MPTYSYRCTQCETAFDIHQAFTDASLTDCPTCTGRLRKVFSSIGVTFNGSGFYRTDSRSAGKGGSGKSSSTTDAKPSASAGASKSGEKASTSSSSSSTAAPAAS